MRKILLAFTLILGVTSAPLLSVSTALATSAAGFKAGEIMDDSVTADSTTMSINDIQNFMNSKVPSCDTNGLQNSEMSNAGVPDYNGNGSIQRWEWGKYHYNQTTFPCLRNYTQSGVSSARMIAYAAHDYQINPKVLLVLLQKEQGLVTDTWPLSIQYKSATGYGCPDSTPGVCNSQYYGFNNQVRHAAAFYHGILANDGSITATKVLGNNTIKWNPSDSCGTSTVNILNRTTVALYTYTPYRPNQAALNAGYGSGNSCSSYGNRNFYLYFTDWFGSTTIPMFRIGSGATIYLSYGDYYYGIPSMSVLRAWGLGGKKVTTVDSSQLSSYTQGPNLGLAAKFGVNATVYLVDSGNIYPAPDWTTMNGYGLVIGNLQTYADTNLMNMLSTQSSLTKLARQSTGTIYFMDGKKHVFPDYPTFTSKAPGLAGTTSFNNFSDELLNTISRGYPILQDGSFFKASDTGGIYLYDSGKRWTFSPNGWAAWGKKIDYSFTNADISQLTSGGNAPVLATDGSTDYIVDSGSKHSIAGGVQTDWGLAGGSFQTVATRSLSRLANGHIATNLMRQPSGAVFLANAGARLLIPSSSDFSGAGYSWSNVINLSSSGVSLVPNSGHFAFAPASLIRLPNGLISLIDTGFASLQFPSLTTFHNYGFSATNVRNFASNALGGYSMQTLLNLIETPTTKHYLADSGHLLSISDTAYGATEYDYGSSSKSTLSDSLISKLHVSGPLTQFIQGSTNKVYKVVNGEKCPLSSQSALVNQGGNWNMVTHVSDAFLSTLATGATLN